MASWLQMARIAKAILIDPFKCEITEVERDAADYTNIYPLLSHESMTVDHFDVVRLDRGDGIFVDDEGLLKPCVRYFLWDGYPQQLAGRGLIVGSNDAGNATAVKITLDEVRRRVTFLELTPIGLLPTNIPWEKPQDE